MWWIEQISGSLAPAPVLVPDVLKFDNYSDMTVKLQGRFLF